MGELLCLYTNLMLLSLSLCLCLCPVPPPSLQVEALIAEHANCTMLNVSGNTPLDLACQNGHANVSYPPGYIPRISSKSICRQYLQYAYHVVYMYVSYLYQLNLVLVLMCGDPFHRWLCAGRIMFCSLYLSYTCSFEINLAPHSQKQRWCTSYVYVYVRGYCVALNQYSYFWCSCTHMLIYTRICLYMYVCGVFWWMR
jgi:hypothetical protein